MTSRKQRFTLLEPPRGSLWARMSRRWANVLQRSHLRALPEPAPLAQAENVDFSLRQRALVQTVRSFIEMVDTYELHNRKTVHVVSHYEIPSSAGIGELVPGWLAHRVRFGVLDNDSGSTHYLDIRAVDVVRTEEGTELYLHLTEKIEPGTRAFVAAWLGEGDGRTGLQDTPNVLIGR